MHKQNTYRRIEKERLNRRQDLMQQKDVLKTKRKEAQEPLIKNVLDLNIYKINLLLNKK